tara:strand:+ start:4653 stop:5531 length:879 start_codon:yes stop_codon:yes gene_type:complete
MKFCLGTVQFGQPYGLNREYYKNINSKFKKILEWNRKAKFFNFLDTAHNYGKAEKIIGNNLNKFDNIKIISKISCNKNNYNFNDLYSNFSQTLERLKMDNLYGILVHDKSMFKKNRIDSTLEFLNYVKKKKFAKKIGLSVYDKSELEENSKYFDFDLIQLPVNIFNQTFIKYNYLQNISKKYEIFVRSIFLQGLLLEDQNKINKYFNKHKFFLNQYYNFLNKNKITPLEACLGLFYSLDLNINIVFGANDLRNIIQIKNAIKNIDTYKIKKLKYKVLSCRDNDLINPSYWKM